MNFSRFTVLTVLTFVVVALAACSGSDDSTPTAPSSGSPQAPTSGTPSPGATATSGEDALPTPQSSDGDSGLLLEIESPQNGAVLSSPAVTVNGRTVPNATVRVNGFETESDVSGTFLGIMFLEEGNNTIQVNVRSPEGVERSVSLLVTFQPCGQAADADSSLLAGADTLKGNC